MVAKYLAILLAVAGCSSGTSVPADTITTPKDYYSWRMSLICKNMVEGSAFLSIERCLATMAPFFSGYLKAAEQQLSDGTMKFDPAAASACIANWPRGPWPVTLLRACDQVFRGFGGIGDACYPNGLGGCADGICDDLCGRCVRLLPDGQPCGAGQVSETCINLCDGKKCVHAPAVAGDICDSGNTACPNGMACVFAPGGQGGKTRRCADELPIGAACTGDSDRCNNLAYCDDSEPRICRILAQPGDSCAERPCVHGLELFCDKATLKCKLRALPGEPCVGPDDCTTALCNIKTKTCVGPSVLGESCVDIANFGPLGERPCVNSACLSGVCAVASPGQPCKVSSDCSGAAICADGTCKLLGCKL